jgi:flagellar hook-associated protein 1 FlgK
MSLSVALNTAKSSLQASGVQTSVTSRNISNQSVAYYSRKIANTVTIPGGGVRIAGIERATDTALFKTMLKSTSGAAAQQALLEGMTKLSETVGDPELEQSPAAKLGKLTNALQQYAAGPENSILAQAVLGAAQGMATTLNQATDAVQDTRRKADADMAASVVRINGLLEQFESINNTIIKGTVAGADITDALDTRDGIVSKLSEEIGVSVVIRDNNDAVLYTDGGVTLFETRPREVRFQPTTVYDATTVGNAVFIDGVPVAGGNSTMPSTTGRLYGYATVRDDLAVTYQNQLDEIARGLIDTFKENDGVNDFPGMFTWPAGTIPPAGTVEQGLAGVIRVNPLIDPDQGGNLDLIRDGIVVDYNLTNFAGFDERLNGIVTELAQTRNFDPAAGADPTNTLADFTTSSVSWVEFNRQQIDHETTYQMTVYERSNEALMNSTGVNLDDELARMLELERAYGASSKLISAVDTMLKSLLAAV